MKAVKRNQAYEFLFARRSSNFGTEVIGLHDHATFKAIFGAIEDRLCRLHCLLGDFQMFFGH